MIRDVVIAGGGFVGVAAAAALAGRRRVTVLEAHADVDPRFRGELIHPRGVDVLEGLGLRAPLARGGSVPIEGFAVVPGADQRPVVLPYTSGNGLPARGLAMSHQAMVACLRAELAARPGIEIHAGHRVTGLLREGDRVVGVETATGERLFADLIILADGRHSKLRGALGIDAEARLLSFTAALMLEELEVPHDRYGHVFLGAPGPVLVYPLDGRRARMCVDVPLGSEKGRDGLVRLLREAYAPFLPGELRAAMLRAAAAGEVELRANHALHTRRAIAPGVALVGDAGGCCHPLTATGLTTGLNDVRVLAEELDATSTLDAALVGYQRRRYHFVRARELLAEALYDVFRGAEAGPRALRSGMIRYWRGSVRARAASMALLSGQESRLGAFVSEYFRVVGRAAHGLLRGEDEGSSWSRRVAIMSEIFRASYAKIEQSFVAAYQHTIHDFRALRTLSRAHRARP